MHFTYFSGLVNTGWLQLWRQFSISMVVKIVEAEPETDPCKSPAVDYIMYKEKKDMDSKEGAEKREETIELKDVLRGLLIKVHIQPSPRS